MYTEEDIYTSEDIIAGVIVTLLVLAWFGFGIWLSHRTRESGCGTKIAVAIVFTKGFVLYWFCYGLFYMPGKIVINFIKGMKEGRVERQQTDQKDEGKQ